MSTATQVKIRATALPLPEPVLGETVTVGYGRQRSQLREMILGEAHLYAGKTYVYQTCDRCSGRGFMGEYAGIYDGECFQCRYRGVTLYAATMLDAQRKVRSKQAAAIRRAAKWEIERPAREAAEKAAAAAMLLAAHEAAIREDERRSGLAAKQAQQRYAGAVGSKVTVTGTVTKAMPIQGHYGTSVLVVVAGSGSDEGITLKTFGTSAWHWDVEEGQQVTVSATVKDREVYGGDKQTVIVRPKAAK